MRTILRAGLFLTFLVPEKHNLINWHVQNRGVTHIHTCSGQPQASANGRRAISGQGQSIVEIGADIHCKPLLAFLLYYQISPRGAFVCPVISALSLHLINIYFTAAWLHTKVKPQRLTAQRQIWDIIFSQHVVGGAGALGWNSLPVTHTYIYTRGKRLLFHLKREARRGKRKNRNTGRWRTVGQCEKPAAAPVRPVSANRRRAIASDWVGFFFVCLFFSFNYKLLQ